MQLGIKCCWYLQSLPVLAVHTYSSHKLLAFVSFDLCRLECHTTTRTASDLWSMQAIAGFQPHHIAQARGSTCTPRNNTLGLVLHHNDTRLVAPVVIVAHQRVHYLARCLTILLR
jgi:hypothetical protein